MSSIDLPDSGDFDPTKEIDRGGILDTTPLKFGKFRGKTPEWVSEHGVKGDDYLRWAYETVHNFPVCSDALYREIGGRGTRAVAVQSPVDKAKAAAAARKRATLDDDGEDLGDIPF